MARYILHFFKERTREFDYEKMLSFFDEIPETKFDEDFDENSNEVQVLYNNPILHSKAKIVISNKSTVRDLHRLDPKYLDVNVRLEVPLVTTNFAARFIFEITKKLTEEFNFFIYNDYFEDIIDFRMQTVERSFTLTKENFKEKYSYKFQDIYYCPEKKLNDILKYVNEQYDLQRYYRDQETYVPNYYLIVDEHQNLFFAMQWQEGKLTVFPPHLNYVYYQQHGGSKTRIIPYAELIAKIEKQTTNVPGFIENTKVISPKMAKRTARILKRAKFTKVEKTFKIITLNQIIDF